MMCLFRTTRLTGMINHPLGIASLIVLVFFAWTSDVQARTASPRVLRQDTASSLVRLVHPHDTECLELAGWELVTMQPGPGCMVSFLFRRDNRDLAFRLALDGDKPVWKLLGTGDPSEAEALFHALRDLVAPNDPQRLLDEACVAAPDDKTSKSTVDAGPQARPGGTPWWVMGLFGGLALLMTVLCGVRLARSGWLDSMVALTEAPGWRDPKLRCTVGIVFVGAMLVPRLFFMASLPIHELELIPLEGSDSLHAPLHPMFVSAWSRLGELFGVGLDPLWLRLPNVILCIALVRLLFRAARWARFPLAGICAAVVFAFTPSCIHISVLQEHYLAEAVAAMWFLERLQWYLAEERRVPPGLWVAAGLCLWTGFVTAFVVAPGLLVLAYHAFRRGQLRSLLTASAVTAACCLPPFVWGLIGLMDHLEFIALTDLSGTLRDEKVVAFGHPAMSASEGVGSGSFLRFLPDVVGGLLWRNESIWLGLVALPAIVAGVRRPVAAVIVVAVVAMAAAGMGMRWSMENTTFLWIPLVWVVFLGAAPMRRATSLQQAAACAAVLGGILFITWGLPPGTARETDALSNLGSREVARAIRMEPGVDLVMLYNHREVDPILHILCDVDSRDAFLACRGGLKTEMSSNWFVESGAIPDRRFHAVKSFGIPAPDGLAYLETLVDQWGVRARSHFVLVVVVAWARDEFSAAMSLSECAVMTRTRGYILYRCPGPPKRSP